MVNDITLFSPKETQAGWAFFKTHQGVSFQLKKKSTWKEQKEFNPNHCTKKSLSQWKDENIAIDRGGEKMYQFTWY